MKIHSIEDIPKNKIIEFFKLHWGSSKMVISSGVYDCSELDGFTVVNEEGKIIGLITYKIRNNETRRQRRSWPIRSISSSGT